MGSIGEDLYAIIVEIHPELAPKLTGMLLQLGEEECIECLDDHERLAVRVDEAMAILDQSGQCAREPVKADAKERRVDPTDGKARTLDELRKACHGKYSPAEIDEYWLTMVPEGQPAAASKKAADEDIQDQPSVESHEAPLPQQISAWLDEMQLSKYGDAASNWADEQGACSLEEIIENLEDFAADLGLKTLEKNRLLKNPTDAAKVAREVVAKAMVQTPAKPTPSAVQEPAPNSKESTAKAKAGAVKKTAVKKAVKPPTASEKKAAAAAALEEYNAGLAARASETAAIKEAEAAKAAAAAAAAAAKSQAELDAIEREREELAREEAELAELENEQPTGSRGGGYASRPSPTAKAPTVRKTPVATQQKFYPEDAELARRRAQEQRDYERAEKARMDAEQAEEQRQAAEAKKMQRQREADERIQRAAAELAAKAAASGDAAANDDNAGGDFPALGADGWAAAGGKKGKKRR
eukprot:TRINITY_DN51291_c0_g1_i1.p1 TRINITY_DN51291_c0_g1~~TRINITY_DN51291_c0_g1_i1.p1  ORF type:complete len:470 (+),score=143.48 TRINITY_DN51291_c0_g1_i1:70-1479(+)